MMPGYIFRRMLPAALCVALLSAFMVCFSPAGVSPAGAEEMPAHFIKMLDGLRVQALRFEKQGRLVEARQRLEVVLSLAPGDKASMDRAKALDGRMLALGDERFSAGMKQRIGLAQALVNHPKLIILDEADAMTNDAQFALRRVIEKHTKNGDP